MAIKWLFTLQVAVNAVGNPPCCPAMLDIHSTPKEILAPGMTMLQRNGIANPVPEWCRLNDLNFSVLKKFFMKFKKIFMIFIALKFSGLLLFIIVAIFIVGTGTDKVHDDDRRPK